MDELVKMVVQPESPKTWLGRLWTRWWAISRENCRTPIASQLDGAISGGGGAGTLGDLAKKAGGLLGGE